MLIQEITWTAEELNSQSGLVKNIFDQSIEIDGLNNDYLPRSILINNNTGNTINYLILTTEEYTEYESTSGAISDLNSIENIGITTIENGLGENLSKILIQGTGSHNSDLLVHVLKTSNGTLNIQRFYKNIETSGVVPLGEFDNSFSNAFG
jgi:hypothetical protein